MLTDVGSGVDCCLKPGLQPVNFSLIYWVLLLGSVTFACQVESPVVNLALSDAEFGDFLFDLLLDNDVGRDLLGFGRS